jgi:D-allulose-6-phosphate 3-epimerase
MGMRNVGSGLQLAASVMCLNLLALADELRLLEAQGVDRWHIDLVDGLYAPNLGLPLRLVGQLRRFSMLPIDVHLMAREPARYITDLSDAGADTVSVPLTGGRADALVAEALDRRSVRLGLIADPRDIPDFDAIERLRPYKLTVMATRPGFTGQPFLPQTVEILINLRSWRDREKAAILIEVDGAVGPRTAPVLVAAGANILVLGSTVFGQGAPGRDPIAWIRSATAEAAQPSAVGAE